MARLMRKLLPAETLNAFKYEVASELGILPKVESVGWSEMSSRECGSVGGRIGGNMVRSMIRFAEESLANPGE